MSSSKDTIFKTYRNRSPFYFWILLTIVAFSMSGCASSTKYKNPERHLTITLVNPEDIKPFYIVIVQPEKIRNFIDATYDSVLQSLLSNNVKYIYINNSNLKKTISIPSSNDDLAVYFLLNQNIMGNWKFFIKSKEILVGKKYLDFSVSHDNIFQGNCDANQ